MPELREELLIFLAAVVTGMTVRLSYRCVSCFRQVVRHSLFAVGIEDLCFWIAAAFYMFVQIYYTSSGSIRWYFVLGLVLGALICSCLLRKFSKNGEKNLHPM